MLCRLHRRCRRWQRMLGFRRRPSWLPRVAHGAFGIFRHYVKCRFVDTPPSLWGQLFALQYGDRTFRLKLNRADISVAGRRDGQTIAAALQSPPTRSAPIDPLLQAHLLQLLDYSIDDLDMKIPPAKIHGGADHVVLALKKRNALARMNYDFERGRELMERAGLITIALVTAENPQLFHVRNAFAAGGVLEDPATGAAAAAFAGYLRDIGWPHAGVINIVQGEDMGMRSLIRAEISEIAGSSIRVSGTARIMNDA
jgi:PhzF family phenazine biosynthesis protein